MDLVTAADYCEDVRMPGRPANDFLSETFSAVQWIEGARFSHRHSGRRVTNLDQITERLLELANLGPSMKLFLALNPHLLPDPDDVAPNPTRSVAELTELVARGFAAGVRSVALHAAGAESAGELSVDFKGLTVEERGEVIAALINDAMKMIADVGWEPAFLARLPLGTASPELVKSYMADPRVVELPKNYRFRVLTESRNPVGRARQINRDQKEIEREYPSIPGQLAFLLSFSYSKDALAKAGVALVNAQLIHQQHPTMAEEAPHMPIRIAVTHPADPLKFAGTVAGFKDAMGTWNYALEEASRVRGMQRRERPGLGAEVVAAGF